MNRKTQNGVVLKTYMTSTEMLSQKGTENLSLQYYESASLQFCLK